MHSSACLNRIEMLMDNIIQVPDEWRQNYSKKLHKRIFLTIGIIFSPLEIPLCFFFFHFETLVHSNKGYQVIIKATVLFATKAFGSQCLFKHKQCVNWIYNFWILYLSQFIHMLYFSSNCHLFYFWNYLDLFILHRRIFDK